MSTTRATQSNLMAPGFRKIFTQNMDIKAWPQEYSQVYNVESSKRQYEEDSLITGFGTMPEKQERAEVTFDDPIQGNTKRYTHATFALGFRVSEEVIEDDLYNKIKQMPKELSISAQDIVEVKSADVFINGFTDSADYRGPDGEPLFGDGTTLDHPRLDGGRWQNQLSVAADLSVDSAELMMTLMEGTVNDRGLRARMTGALFIVPRQLRFTVDKILESAQEAFTAQNQTNTLRKMDLEYFVWHYLTDPDAWFVQAATHYLNFFWRVKAALKNDDDFGTGDALFKTRERFSQGYTDPRGIAGTPGSN